MNGEAKDPPRLTPKGEVVAVLVQLGVREDSAVALVNKATDAARLEERCLLIRLAYELDVDETMEGRKWIAGALARGKRT